MTNSEARKRRTEALLHAANAEDTIARLTAERDALRAQVEAVRDQLAEVAELAEDRGITVGQVRDLLDGWEADYRQYLSIVENGKPNRWITDLRRILDAADGGDETCGCWTCMSERPGPLGMPMTASVMVTCPTCGNKRCPRSTHHDNACLVPPRGSVVRERLPRKETS